VRRVLWIIAIALVVLLLVHTVGTLTLEARYEAALDRLRADGQPVLPRDLATEPVPDAENLAVGLREASEWLARWHETHPEPDELLVDRWREEWFEPEERAALEAYLRSIEPYLDLVEAALARPGFHLDVDWDAGPNMQVPLISRLQEASEAFANCALYLDDPATRTDRIVRAARVCRELGDRCELPFVIGHLVQEVVRTYVVSIVYESRGRPGFDAVRLQAELDPFLREAPRGPPGRPLAEERTIGIWVFETWRAGGSIDWPESEIIDTLESSYVARPLMYMDALRYLETVQDGIDACAVTPAEALAAAESLPGPQEFGVPYVVTRLYAPVPIRLNRYYGEGAAQLRLCRVALALMARRQTTGAWPETLAELGDLPTDPYSGEPFQYLAVDDYARLWCARDREWELNADAHLAWEWER
jgi:hypothetical protein